jgi:hypothetical protein
MSLLRNALSGYSQSTAQTINLQGTDGTTYGFELHFLGSWFHPFPGVYAVFKQTAPNQFQVLYIGEGGDLDARAGEGWSAHHKWPVCTLELATHIGVLVVGGDRDKRLTVETNLRHFYNPPLNDQ